MRKLLAAFSLTNYVAAEAHAQNDDPTKPAIIVLVSDNSGLWNQPPLQLDIEQAEAIEGLLQAMRQMGVKYPSKRIGGVS